MKKILSVVFAVAMIFAVAAPVFAQGGKEATTGVNFPAGDALTIIVPVSAGAGMDTQAKLMQKYIEKYLGKTVIIENIAGGATTLAAQDYLAREKNDDCIIMLSTDHRVFSPILQKSDYSYESFVSLSANNFTEEYFWVNVDSPFQTWADVVEASKTKPVIFGTGAKSGPVYIATKAACVLTGVEMENVVSNSIPESIANMLGGHVEITWSSYPTARDYYLSGKIRPILGTGLETFTGDHGELSVPTLSGMGYDFAFSSCNTFCMRADTDPEIVEYMRNILRQAYLDPEFKADWEAAGNTYLEDSTYEFADKAVAGKVALIPTVKEIFGL